MAAGTHVALLRGVNVGGRNSLPMRQLAAMFEAAGCERVRTYIQSGNVVFDATKAVADGLASVIAAEIATAVGIAVPVIVRSAATMEAIAAGNPFLGAGVEAKTLHVIFLSARPSAKAVNASRTSSQNAST